MKHTASVVDPALGAALQAARQAAGFTYLKLCGATGLSLNTVSNALKGVATERTLELMAQALGVTVEQLRGQTAEAGHAR